MRTAAVATAIVALAEEAKDETEPVVTVATGATTAAVEALQSHHWRAAVVRVTLGLVAASEAAT